MSDAERIKAAAEALAVVALLLDAPHEAVEHAGRALALVSALVDSIGSQTSRFVRRPGGRLRVEVRRRVEGAKGATRVLSTQRTR